MIIRWNFFLTFGQFFFFLFFQEKGKEKKKRKTGGGKNDNTRWKRRQIFMLLADALDTIRPKYRRVVPPHQPAANYPATLPNRAYLDVHLEFITTRHSAKVGNCTVSNLQDGHDDDNPRVALPSTIINLMRANNCQWSTSVSQKPKVPSSDMDCLLPQRKPSW